jgi:hypothetical protein
MSKRSEPPARASSRDAKDLFDAVVSRLDAAIQAEKQKFFPNGIELLEIGVKVATIDVSVKIAGPKAAALAGGGVQELRDKG